MKNTYPCAIGIFLLYISSVKTVYQDRKWCVEANTRHRWVFTAAVAPFGVKKNFC